MTEPWSGRSERRLAWRHQRERCFAAEVELAESPDEIHTLARFSTTGIGKFRLGKLRDRIAKQRV